MRKIILFMILTLFVMQAQALAFIGEERQLVPVVEIVVLKSDEPMTTLYIGESKEVDVGHGENFAYVSFDEVKFEDDLLIISGFASDTKERFSAKLKDGESFDIKCKGKTVRATRSTAIPKPNIGIIW